MSTSQQAAQQTVTAANIMSEEKSYRIVRFAVTGQRDADFIAGISALVIELGYAGSPRNQQRVFEFLASMTKDAADREDDQIKAQELWQHRMQTMQSPAPPPLKPFDQSVFGQLYGSSGGSVLPGAAQQSPINSAWEQQIANSMSAVGVNDVQDQEKISSIQKFKAVWESAKRPLK